MTYGKFNSWRQKYLSVIPEYLEIRNYKLMFARAIRNIDSFDGWFTHFDVAYTSDITHGRAIYILKLLVRHGLIEKKRVTGKREVTLYRKTPKWYKDIKVT